MSDRPETEIIARIMAWGYNRHIRDHGPDGDYAGEAAETRDGHGVMVSRGGTQFAVRVERLPAAAEGAPLSPGQSWAELKNWLGERITSDLAVAEGFKDTDPGAAAALYALVSANRSVLAKMRELEAGQ